MTLPSDKTIIYRCGRRGRRGRCGRGRRVMVVIVVIVARGGDSHRNVKGGVRVRLILWPPVHMTKTDSATRDSVYEPRESASKN